MLSFPENASENAPLFLELSQPPPLQRIPNFGHLAILILIALCALFGAAMLAQLGLHFHLFGVTTVAQAATDIHYTLGTEGILYVLTLIGSAVIFPIVWHKGLLDGVHWQGSAAVRRSRYLIFAAVACFALALVNGMTDARPCRRAHRQDLSHARRRLDALCFGVTFAPFFEEIAFRGFLLPALCTAFDWFDEKTTGKPLRPLDENNHPQWSMPAMVVSSILTSLPFARHARGADGLLARAISSTGWRKPGAVLGAAQHALACFERHCACVLQLPAFLAHAFWHRWLSSTLTKCRARALNPLRLAQASFHYNFH